MTIIMLNAIRLVKQEEISKIKDYFLKKGDKGLLVELQGNELRTWQMYARHIGAELNFPAIYQETEGEYIVDSYLDWIRDLSWYEKTEEFAIIIYNYNLFLRDERGHIRGGKYGNYVINKELIVCSFVDSVLPWWEYEVEQRVVGGKAKPFNVYLVD